MYSVSVHRVDLNSSGMQESFHSPGISSPEGKGLEYFLSKGEENHATMTMDLLSLILVFVV